MKPTDTFFNGAVKVRLDDFPPEAWTVVVGDPMDGKKSAQYFASVVAWMYACVQDRCNTLASMPWELMRGDTVVVESGDAGKWSPPRDMEWFADINDILHSVTASELLTGRAYLFRERNRLRTTDVRYLLPGTIKPQYDRNGRITHFERTTKGTTAQRLEVDELIYFFVNDWGTEGNAPAQNYPGKAAMNAASVNAHMDTFLTGYFERGMVKATLLTYDGVVNNTEKERLREWWRRIFTGTKNAFGTEVVRGSVQPVIIGEGIKDIDNDVLTVAKRREIEVAFGLPETRLNQAANLATKKEDERQYITSTIMPHAKHVAQVLNRQLLAPLGYRLVFHPDKLSVMQEDEHARSQSLSLLKNSGVPLLMAMDILGYSLTDGQRAELEEKQNHPPPAPPMMPEQPDPRQEEIRQFRNWYQKRVDKNPDINSFNREYMTYTDMIAVTLDIEGEPVVYP